MRRTTAGVFLLILIAVGAWLAVALFRAPAPLDASARPGEFSAGRAFEHVKAIAATPRPMGSARHEEVRDYLVGQLRQLGLDPQVQTATGRSPSGRTFGRVENIVARLRGAAGREQGAVLLDAHYDSVPSGPGASDDGAGVAVLLETLRALQAGPPVDRDVIVLFSDGEERGLLGADAFAESHPWAKDVGVVLNFEARGTRGPGLMFETGPGNRWLIEHFAAAAPYPAAASYSYEVYRRLPNDTDFTVFRKHGLGGLNFAFIHGAVGYHTAMDSIEHCDRGSIQQLGSNALAMVRVFGEAPELGPAADRPSGDAVYFNPLGRTFLWYPAGWVLALLGLLEIAGIAVLGLALARRRVGVGSLVVGFFVHVVLVVALFGIGRYVASAIFRFPYDFRIWGDESSLAWSLFGLVLVAVGLEVILFRLVRRKLSGEGLAAGGLLLWLLATAAVSLTAPGASYLFMVPLFFQLFALGVFLAGRPKASGDEAGPAPVGLGTFVLLALSAVVAMLIWAPTLSILAVGLRFVSAGVLTALVPLILALLVPQMDLASGLRPAWLVGRGVLLLGVVLILVVRFSCGFGPESPRPDGVIYTLDADHGEAHWWSVLAPDPWVRKVLPEAPERGSLQPFLGDDRKASSGPARVLDLPSARVEPLEEAGGLYRFRVLAPEGTELVRLLIPKGAVQRVVVDGREAAERDDRPVVVTYLAPPPDGVEVSVKPAAPGPVSVAVVSERDELPSVEQGGPGPRPPWAMRTGRLFDADSTLVRKSFEIGPGVPPAAAGDAASPAGGNAGGE